MFSRQCLAALRPAGMALALLLPTGAALAQPAPAQPAPQTAPQQAPANLPAWETLPAMRLERLYGGPLKDTIIQRWRDPIDGNVCYVYLPITAQHTPPTPNSYVQYGPNQIGSISCTSGHGAAAAPARPAGRGR